MKIGILYISTGPYIEFFDEFFLSAEKNFLPDCEKHYFVFTDGENPLFGKNPRIHVISQHQFEWPYAVLFKFHYFLQAQHHLKDMDYLVMTNANVSFVDIIDKNEILPNEKENFLFGTVGPWLYKSGEFKLLDENFEQNPVSKAYIPYENRKTYYASGFCGGRTKEFLEMFYKLRDWTEQDLSKNIMAKWEDQAYLNRYFSEFVPKQLTPAFCYPEEYEVPFQKKVLILYKQDKKNDPLKKYYRKYSWDKKTIAPKNIFQKFKKYSIYYLIKFLKRFE